MVSIKSPPLVKSSPSVVSSQSVHQQIRTGKPISLKGHIATATKSKAEDTEIRLQLCSDIEQVTKMIFPDLGDINNRLRQYDPDLTFNAYPKHYPVQVLEGRGATPFHNVFLSVPKSSEPEDQLGLEFIDAWLSIYIQIVSPVIQTVFDRESIELIFERIDPAMIGIVIYWTSLSHEWGHMVGPYKVLPPTPQFSKLNSLFQGMLGETAANATAAILTPEHPEVALWILIFHLGYTGRKGYREDPIKGWINTDNDTFAAIFLYQRMIADGVLEVTHDRKLHLHFEKLLICYDRLRTAIDDLANWAFQLPEKQCNQAFQNWLEKEVPYDHYNSCFVFPEGLKRVYSQVQMIPEHSHHKPLLPFLVD